MMDFRKIFIALFTLSVLLCLSSPALANSSIETARQAPSGAEITVTGRVTVTSGQFASASFDQGFAIQDPTGGIYVSTDQPLTLQAGDSITVSGTLQDDGHGQRMIQMQAVHPEAGNLQVEAQPVTIAQAKQLDGSLVTVHGTLTRAMVDDAPYGDRLWLTDETGTAQIYIPRSTGINPAQLPWLKPGQLLQVTGLSSDYDGNDEVIPRDLADLVPSGMSFD
ncbi:MAG: hypothetical protein ACFB0C_10670 [Leptolyngbyaceae cyanobacterium]